MLLLRIFNITLSIIDIHRLIINNASESDSGEYRCAAWNDYSNATSTVPLLIQGNIVKLIVKLKYKIIGVLF